ncbi:hypothetical protein A4S06_08790 [Erysipelotrichaceae bacterium MTC7]|nr:hypothetical protein A4S06_08790 [Erysipelotrichaceae bacterium MTC7]
MNKKEREPLYYRLADIIEEKISSGEWKKGKPIPSERELCKMYDMSRITVRNAIDLLANQGKLEKIQGKGTFVVGTSILQNLGNVYSFSKEMEKQGKISDTILVDKKIIQANKKVARELGINEHDEVIYIERLRCDEQTPIIIEKTFFPMEYKFVIEIDLDNQPLYQTLDETYNIQINRAIETFQACELNEYECKMLLCKQPQYGLLVQRTSFSNDKIVCYSSLVSKGDIYKFTVKLES